MRPMSIGTSVFLIIVGAILRYAITADPEGVDLDTVGLILLIAGFAGLAISALYILVAGGDSRGQSEEAYQRERDDYYGGGGPPPPR